MSGAHRVEVSSTSRAVCKNTECKKGGIKIQKGQLRYGTFITASEWQSWAWKHWGCVTPKQISNLKEELEGDPSQLDGYDELPEDFQEKIVNALEQGHIDDEDWGWDIEMNREGKNGYFTVESKRRLKAEAQALKDEAVGEENASSKKTDGKKRGHVKDEPDAEDAAEGEPPAKKTKARSKKASKTKDDRADGGSEDEGPPVEKTKSRNKREPKVKIEGSETRSENEVSPNKKTKAAVKKSNKANTDEANRDFEQVAQPVKKGRKRAKKPTRGEAALHMKDESSDHDALPPPISKRIRASRKAATAKKIKDEDTDTDGLDRASELGTPLGSVKREQTSELEAEPNGETPKVEKRRKKAPKKAVSGTADNRKEDNLKAISAGPRPTGRLSRSRPA